MTASPGHFCPVCLRRINPAQADRHALKLDEFLPYRLNVCASLVSQALSRIYSARYRIGVPE